MSSEVFDRFVAQAPFALMPRVLAHSFIGGEMRHLFEAHRETQYEYLASFESVAIAVADVALNFSDNFNQAYKKHKSKLGVSRQSFYAKTRGIEPAVSEAIVSHWAQQAIGLQEALQFVPREVLPGYRCFSIDGNVLAKSDKRLKVLQELGTAPLPGKVIARFEFATTSI